MDLSMFQSSRITPCSLASIIMSFGVREKGSPQIKYVSVALVSLATAVLLASQRLLDWSSEAPTQCHPSQEVGRWKYLLVSRALSVVSYNCCLSFLVAVIAIVTHPIF